MDGAYPKTGAAAVPGSAGQGDGRIAAGSSGENGRSRIPSFANGSSELRTIRRDGLPTGRARSIIGGTLASTYAYTTESEGEWFHYKAVNAELRKVANDGRSPDRPVWDYMLTLNDALNRLPDWRPMPGKANLTWRGVNLSKNGQDAYTPGSIHT